MRGRVVGDVTGLVAEFDSVGNGVGCRVDDGQAAVVLVRDKNQAVVGVVRDAVREVAGDDACDHLVGGRVDGRELVGACRSRVDTLPVGGDRDAVHVGELRHDRYDVKGVEVDHVEGRVAEVRDVELPPGRIDALVVEARRVPGKRYVDNACQRETAGLGAGRFGRARDQRPGDENSEKQASTAAHPL